MMFPGQVFLQLFQLHWKPLSDGRYTPTSHSEDLEDRPDILTEISVLSLSLSSKMSL